MRFWLFLLLLFSPWLFAEDNPTETMKKGFEAQLVSIQKEFQQAQTLLESLPENLSLQSTVYDDIEKSIQSTIDLLNDDAPIFAQLNALEQEFQDAKLEYFGEYINSNDVEFREIAEEFAKLEIKIQENRAGIIAEREQAKALKAEFVVLRKKTVAWLRLNRAQQATQAVDEFRQTFDAANQRLNQYVTGLKEVDAFNQIEVRIPVN